MRFVNLAMRKGKALSGTFCRNGPMGASPFISCSKSDFSIPYHLVRRIESDSKLDYVLLFENADGHRKLAAWTSPPPGGAPNEVRPHRAAIHTSESLAAESGRTTPANETAAIPLRVILTGAHQYVTVPRDVDFERCVALEPGIVPARREVQINVSYQDFQKTYVMACCWSMD